MVVVESVIALESFLSELFYNKWSSAGISDTDIKNRLIDLGLTKLVTNELRLIFDNKIKDETISNVKGVIKKRNNIIHNKFKDITPSDANDAIKHVIELIEEIKEIQKLRKSVYGLDYPIIPFKK